MNRRRFLELLSMAAVGGTVAYSFPDVIVPKNIQLVTFDMLEKAYTKARLSSAEPNLLVIHRELYPKLIEDIFFIDDPLTAFTRKNYFNVRPINHRRKLS
jgi:hypothetical protein